MPYTWATFKDAVKGLMSDAKLNNTTVVLAVAEYVKAKIVLNVDKNPNLAQFHLTNWLTQRNRLVGFPHTLTDQEIKDQVRVLLTVDSKRYGIQSYIDQLINIAINEIDGVKDFVDVSIRQGVLDLQHFIEFYRKNHETRYKVTDVSVEGVASRGALPSGAMVWDAYYVRDGSPCVRMPVTQYDWQNRFDLTCCSPPMHGNEFFISIEPNAATFIAFPEVVDGAYLSVFWDGLKDHVRGR